jgi:hypothetical protein
MGQIDGADFIVRLVEMPSRVHAYTSVDIDGIYNIYVNQVLPYERQVASFQHEVGHIIQSDFYNRTDIRTIEA